MSARTRSRRRRSRSGGSGPLARPDTPRLQTVRAWSLGDAAAAVGLALDEHVVAALNGDQITRDPQLPLVAGDAVAFMAADAGG